jgi:hypothetical protein
MSNFSSHIKELRELIAGSSSAAGPASAHFEAKLREVLPSLLRDHVLPSPTGASFPSSLPPRAGSPITAAAVGLSDILCNRSMQRTRGRPPRC